jgi:hypothetical protein
MSVLVHIYYDSAKHHILAQKGTTIRQLLFDFDIQDKIVFSGRLEEPNKTPLVDLSKTLADYNMWFLDKGYIAELTVYKETDNYDKELYDMLSAFS